ncbi:MAG TPA: hypothetical protein PKV16_08270 [Caldisericia bacterium]|mgnify:CR=1 FL=1|nr:hypothetical protein [Caldisericia bacterium]HPF49771.1 hypothetical protein [Caldisericia bacterium]HPI84332.1 hypothetical protein [Caldisericia bacterium]HPQ93759.1 hypothetical protein [Caldisericia bacterium]HRV74817.1 hypothetical protein [Caldisericia bacterium]
MNLTEEQKTQRRLELLELGYVCPFMVECPFLASLALPSIAETLKVIYCKNMYKKCARFHMKSDGQKPPLNMWPNGHIRVRSKAD